MKFKTTKKEMRESTNTVYAAGYCQLQNLLSHEREKAFSSGIYGWACDYYEVDFGGVYCWISTGYAPIGKHIDYDIMKKYDLMAEKLRYSKTYIDYETLREDLRALIVKMIKETQTKEGAGI